MKILMLRKLRRAISRKLDCWLKGCDYYQHYLAYGSAELTHEGYHAACQHCDYWQKRDMEFLKEHPDTFDSPYRRQCEFWERQVRA